MNILIYDSDVKYSNKLLKKKINSFLFKFSGRKIYINNKFLISFKVLKDIINSGNKNKIDFFYFFIYLPFNIIDQILKILKKKNKYFVSIRHCLLDAIERKSGDIQLKDLSNDYIYKHFLNFLLRSLKIILILEYLKFLIDFYKIDSIYLPQLDGYPYAAISALCKNKDLFMASVSYNLYSSKNDRGKYTIMIRKERLKERIALPEDLKKLSTLSDYKLNKIIEKIKNQFLNKNDPYCPPPKSFNRDIRERQSKILKSIKDNKKKTAIVMLHIFTDQSRFRLENTWLDNYLDWTYQTIEFCKINNNVNWIFKGHPNEDGYPISKKSKNKLINKIIESGFLYIDSKDYIVHDDIEKFAELIVTCNGSCKIEYHALFNIPVISCVGEFIPYDTFSQPFTAKNSSEYKELILNASNLSLTKENVRRAKEVLAFYKTIAGVDIDEESDINYLKDFNGKELMRNF
tara:strand:- start:10490 stop:11869 length:1380 start_codon:yes stop_codon:yes gene_type:complete